MSIATHLSMRVSRIVLWLVATTTPIIGAAHAESASPAPLATQAGGISERLALCSRSIALSGLEKDMDETIRKTAEDSFTTLKAAFPDDTKTAAAYRDSMAEAMTAAKAPVLDRVQKSCAAAFTAEELVAINTFFGGPVGQAWLEKSRTLMIPALEDAIRDVTPKVLADAEKRFCDRMGGCTNPPPAKSPASTTL